MQPDADLSAEASDSSNACSTFRSSLSTSSRFNPSAVKVSFEDLQPLFNTAKKKVGTRIACTVALKGAIKNGLDELTLNVFILSLLI